MATIPNIKWRNLERVLNEFADFFLQSAMNRLSDSDSNASFNLYNSLEKIIEIGEDSYSVKISLEDYWKYLEDGTNPHWAPIGPLKEWVSVKGIEPTRPDKNGRIPSVEQLPYMIQWKIAREGTKGKPFFGPSKDDAIERFRLSIDYAIDEDVSVWVNECVEEAMKESMGGL